MGSGQLKRNEKNYFGLKEVIKKCLYRDPIRRYQDYEAILIDLEQAMSHQGFIVSTETLSTRGKRDILNKHTGFSFEKSVEGKDGYILTEAKELEPYIEKVSALMSINNYKEAKIILEGFYIPDLIYSEDWSHYHSIAVNYGFCLSQIYDDQVESLTVYESIAHANPKPAEFYVNYSLALLRKNNHRKAEEISRRGLAVFPEDNDILGNLLISLLQQERFDEALPMAKKRLSQKRDIRSLNEVSCLLTNVGEQCIENWPQAVKCYKESLALLKEALKLNPRYGLAKYNYAFLLKQLHYPDIALKECLEIYDLDAHHSIREMACCLEAELLSVTGKIKECAEFCQKILPQLKLVNNITRLKRINAKVLTDHYMVGVNDNDGTRIVIQDPITFFEEQTRDINKAELDDLIYLAKIREWLGKKESAINLFNTAIKRDAKSWEAYMEKSLFLFRGDQISQALDAMETAISLAPYRSKPLDMLSFIYKNIGQEKESQKAKAKANKVHESRMSYSNLETS